MDMTKKADPNEPVAYTIRLRGHFGSAWANWFEGMVITLLDDGDTLLTGPVSDQAALHGLLKKVRDLGIPLLALNRIELGEAAAPDRDNILGGKT